MMTIMMMMSLRRGRWHSHCRHFRPPARWRDDHCRPEWADWAIVRWDGSLGNSAGMILSEYNAEGARVEDASRIAQLITGRITI
jgi:hypothetical protein